MSLATPFRWPSSWQDPSFVDLIKGTAVDRILMADDPALDRVRTRTREFGIAVSAAAPPGAVIVPGAWPGVKMARGGGNQVEAGPTGVPWVDSNGWLIRLTRALHPDSAVWVDAPPKDAPRFTPESYMLAVADAAAHGGRWILTLDDAQAAQVKADAPGWKRMLAAAAFFQSREVWGRYVPQAVLGVVSDFTGPNEFMGQELLNLVSRGGQQYRVVRKDAADFAGLRAVLYADGQPPADGLRKQAIAFVEAGGLLIAAPSWGEAPGRAVADEHPRFSQREHGKGRIAIAKAVPDDPWVLANDAAVLVSHRYDLVRCFNSGSFGSYYTMSPDRKKAVVHVLFYAGRGPTEATVRVVGRYRSAAISSVDEPEPKPVKAEFSKEAVEVYLPKSPQYVALELSV